MSDTLRSAAREFLAKYDELIPAVNNAFLMQQIHGMPYTGPNWAQELKALRDAVAKAESVA